MKLLLFQARHFHWQPFSQSLPTAIAAPEPDGLDDVVAAFVHVEARDQPPEHRARAFRHTLKHIKWLANKRGLRNVALHSFAHLGGDTAEADFARAFLDELAARLADTGYTVKQTPFGWFNGWQLDVYGDSLAKVWKDIG